MMTSDVNVITSSLPLFNRLRTLVPECTWRRLDPRHCHGKIPETPLLLVDAGDFLHSEGRSLISDPPGPSVVLLARSREKDSIPQAVMAAARQVITLPLSRQELLNLISSVSDEHSPVSGRMTSGVVITDSLSSENETEQLRNDLREKCRELSRVRKDLQRKNQELSTIHKVGEIVKTTFVLEELSRMIVELVTSVMACSRCSILVIDDREGDLLIKGAKGLSITLEENARIRTRGAITMRILETGEHLMVNDIEAQMGLAIDRNKGYHSGSFISYPIKVRGEIIGIINVADKLDSQPFNAKDLKLLETLTSQVGLTLENFRMSQELLDKERIQKELEIAWDIQTNLLQKQGIRNSRFGLWVYNRPAREMGGDFYNFSWNEGNRLDLFLADVSGKGIPAALVMVMLRSYLKISRFSFADCGGLLTYLNDLLLEDISDEMFVTAFSASLDLETMTLRFANGGHLYPLLFRNGSVFELMARGHILGMFENIDYEESEIVLKSGDTVVFYTDGINEAMDAGHNEFGKANLVNCVAGCLESIVQSGGDVDGDFIIGEVCSVVDQFTTGMDQSDDQTLLVLNIP
ncbi:MAG: hypothetical protein CVV64_10555 [Candidatus Wallbacteria bacterium HGW-Wallbacteria-1]|jgi:sigma-B regulation protein RsbU (phosphoserine phosphatase)|uniref:PPM-type phosphatase domain-containing protein n=1 Tax=Candidatus Wallbacteria bacterium HGW-Wallbacteria-1 TaxID=2013854 RepID=A0A2N1PP98_9BACT|nr:MAG: hypothetical protein CVV64_10555 [Candidatus Wallbacteria bacterium HGW-Wallbacteria-1]